MMSLECGRVIARPRMAAGSVQTLSWDAQHNHHQPMLQRNTNTNANANTNKNTNTNDDIYYHFYDDANKDKFYEDDDYNDDGDEGYDKKVDGDNGW